MRYHLGLGSNIGERELHLRESRRRIEQTIGDIVKTSSLYETEPVGLTDQPWFLNQAVEVKSGRSPDALLLSIKLIERNMGRISGPRFGPRIIDIDILLAGETICRTRDLTIPHPRLAQRNFMLYPLREIAGDIIHPEIGKTIGELVLDSADRSDVRRCPLYR